MKRKLSMFLALALLLSLCTVSAYAGEDEPVNGFYDIDVGTSGLTIKAKKDGAAVDEVTVDVDGDGSNDTVYPGSNQLDVSFTTGDAGYQYLVLLYTGSDPVPTVGNEICYINQTADESGNVNFLVYPNLDGVKGAMTLMITSDAPGFTTKTVTLYYAPSYTLGDVDGNGSITSADALEALKHSVGKITLTGNEFLAANVISSDDAVTSADALEILKYSVGKITSFN